MHEYGAPSDRDELEPTFSSGKRMLALASIPLVIVAVGALVWVVSLGEDGGSSDPKPDRVVTGSRPAVNAVSAPPASIPWCDDLPAETPEYSQAERQSATDLLLGELRDSYFDRTGDWSSVSGVAHTRSPVEISLNDLTQAPLIADQLRVPPPLDIFCIDPNVSVSDPLGPTPIDE